MAFVYTDNPDVAYALNKLGQPMAITISRRLFELNCNLNTGLMREISGNEKTIVPLAGKAQRCVIHNNFGSSSGNKSARILIDLGSDIPKFLARGILSEVDGEVRIDVFSLPKVPKGVRNFR